MLQESNENISVVQSYIQDEPFVLSCTFSTHYSIDLANQNKQKCDEVI